MTTGKTWTWEACAEYHKECAQRARQQGDDQLEQVYLRRAEHIHQHQIVVLYWDEEPPSIKQVRQ